jgi:hypothetical protein
MPLMFKLPIPSKLVRNVLNKAPGLASLAMPPQVSLGLKVAGQLGILGGGKSDPLGALQGVLGATGIKPPSFLTPQRIKVLTQVAQGIQSGKAIDPLEVINSIGWLKG